MGDRPLIRSIAFSVATSLIAITLLFSAAEIGFRIRDLFDKNRGLKNSMGDINRKYMHGFRPNTRFRLVASDKREYDVGVRINNFGFRGEDFDAAKSPGTVRIMVLGDSFTFGVGAEEDETIPAWIGKLLGGKDANVEVINAGFGHYSPLLHYLKARDEYVEFAPDLVLYLYDFSDLADDWRGEKSVIRDAAGTIIACDAEYQNGKRDYWRTARARSRLCSYVHNKIIRLFDKIQKLGLREYIKAKLRGQHAKAVIIERSRTDPRINTIEYDGYFMMRGVGFLPKIREYFALNEKYLDGIKDIFTERGAAMVLVTYPYGVQVGPEQWGEGRIAWGFERGKVYDASYAFDLLRDYAAKRKIGYVNLLDALQRSDSERLYFERDGHFTPAANRIVAAEIVLSPDFVSALAAARARAKDRARGPLDET